VAAGYEAWRLIAPGASEAPLPASAGAYSAIPAAQAASSDPRMGDRVIGVATAPVTVHEFYSLTCPHCARFALDVLPQIKKELVDPGKLRVVFRDFPLDQLALTAAAIARSLPAERYEPFVITLLASQDRWAFARGINNTEELFKRAALAGMSREAFNATINDTALKNAILAGQEADTKTYSIDSTPTFIFNGPGVKNRREAGERSYQEFADLVAKAAG
jgi:protein-disulfide isomerase